MILDPIDQSIRDQGFNFVPFDRYLAEGFQPNTLDMSGGISTLPTSSLTFPPIPNFNINQGGSDRDNSDFVPLRAEDQGLMTADFAPDQSITGNMGMTEEEEDAINAMRNPNFTKGQIGRLGLEAVFNPLSAAFNAYRMNQKNKAAALEKAREAATAARAAANQAAAERGEEARGGYQAGYGSDFMGGEGRSTGMGAADKGGSDSMGSFAYGGRVPYMIGGLADLVDIYD